ncbi:MAG: alpha/beta fold hydrolase [Halobacterium sp.]
MPPGETRVAEGAETVELPDGRELAYAEYGDPDGVPVFFFHGLPGSRVSGSLSRNRKADLGVRVLAPDRPGFGRSEYAGDRSFADWAEDVAALADALAVEEYGVVGFSGGGPYALACAAHTPERVTGCSVVSGAGPPGVATDDHRRFDRAIRGAARHSVHLARPLAWLLVRRVEAADRFTDVVGEPRDGDLADPRLGETGRILLSDFRESVRQGPTAVARDYAVLARDWDFDLADVAAPTRVFHGSADAAVPPAVGEHVAGEVPDADLTVYDGADHFRPVTEHVADVYGWLAERARDADGGATDDCATDDDATDEEASSVEE